MQSSCDIIKEYFILTLHFVASDLTIEAEQAFTDSFLGTQDVCSFFRIFFEGLFNQNYEMCGSKGA